MPWDGEMVLFLITYIYYCFSLCLLDAAHNHPSDHGQVHVLIYDLLQQCHVEVMVETLEEESDKDMREGMESHMSIGYQLLDLSQLSKLIFSIQWILQQQTKVRLCQ